MKQDILTGNLAGIIYTLMWSSSSLADIFYSLLNEDLFWFFPITSFLCFSILAHILNKIFNLIPPSHLLLSLITLLFIQNWFCWSYHLATILKTSWDACPGLFCFYINKNILKFSLFMKLFSCFVVFPRSFQHNFIELFDEVSEFFSLIMPNKIH